MKIRSKSSHREVCPYCKDSIEDDLVLCEACETPHHADCLNQHEGCAIFGCMGGGIRSYVDEICPACKKSMNASSACPECMIWTCLDCSREMPPCEHEIERDRVRAEFRQKRRERKKRRRKKAIRVVCILSVIAVVLSILFVIFS